VSRRVIDSGQGWYVIYDETTRDVYLSVIPQRNAPEEADDRKITSSIAKRIGWALINAAKEAEK
jgi:hypothetical protein